MSWLKYLLIPDLDLILVLVFNRQILLLKVDKRKDIKSYVMFMQSRAIHR